MKKNIFIILLCTMTFSLTAESISFSADSMTGSIKTNSSSTTLTGHAIVKTETMEIHADQIILSGEDFRFIQAKGNVKGTNSESKIEFSCQTMNYDQETKIASLQDEVSLKDEENDVNATAELIDYDQKNDIAIMQINVNIQQKENTCIASYAIYKKANKTLELSGNPLVKQGEDSFRAQQILFNMDTEEITLDGKVRGAITTSEDKNGK